VGHHRLGLQVISGSVVMAFNPRRPADMLARHMPATLQQRLRVRIRASLPWRKLLPRRTVRRTVDGVQLYMPWSHLLPDYASVGSAYDQNLLALASALARRSPEPLRLLDIGANIGDSALRVLHRVDGRALCVEADPYWARFLRLNAGEDERVEIEEALLLPEDDGDAGFVPERSATTTTWMRASDAQAAPQRLSVRALRERHPEFESVRLIKSDTDGFDPVLVRAAAREWRESGPVLFFEYDPALARRVANEDPSRVWEGLAACGYARLAIWDNSGDPLGQLELDAVLAPAAALQDAATGPGHRFWDVAACRADDRAALDCFDEVLPADFELPGGGRQPHPSRTR
jgi:FkbM family methyltransferase